MENSTLTAVGVWFYSISTQRYLYLLRNDTRHPDSWGLPGGKIDLGETLMEAMTRECKEELGSMPEYIKLVPIEKFTSADGGFSYHTFFCSVANEFTPILNEEHIGWAWIASGTWPRPMHPGLWSTVNFDAVRDKMATVESSFT
jgi:8-oxo-dGTP pyrophosphatase MutT (NUDIX family)|tara:strand:- start:994 stop:1425 length:432 start_codon:yes stop_codon:yes gene_type:complete